MAYCVALTKRGLKCDRGADRIVRGEPFCWQHAEIAVRPWNHWELEERSLAVIDSLAPRYPLHWTWRVRRWLADRLDRPYPDKCAYCGRTSARARLVVNPRTLRRQRFVLCERDVCALRLRDWEGSANARRARAHADWEAENGAATPQDLIRGIPPQYPSVSRRTLRAFIDSGLEHATIPSGEVSALNGTIRTLGFGDEVYAELRSGETVLRRTAESVAA